MKIPREVALRGLRLKESRRGRGLLPVLRYNATFGMWFWQSNWGEP